jgi:hypothetical protein
MLRSYFGTMDSVSSRTIKTPRRVEVRFPHFSIVMEAPR